MRNSSQLFGLSGSGQKHILNGLETLNSYGSVHILLCALSVDLLQSFLVPILNSEISVEDPLMKLIVKFIRLRIN